MRESSFPDDFSELEAVEDFLEYFGVAYDSSLVQVKRLPILQRFHDYLKELEESLPADQRGKRSAYADCLRRAYQDFSVVDGNVEEFCKVFREQLGTCVSCLPSEHPKSPGYLARQTRL
jgi:nitrogenase-stabilizing/protective protein